MPVTIDGTTGISGSGAGLTNLNASNISSGTLAVANGGTGVTTSTGTGSVVLSNSPTLVTPALGTPSSGNGSNLTNLNASNISSGTVPTARLGTGTADSTTFLRGDGTWATAGGAPTTAQVLSATAGASVGAVGTYAFLSPPTTGSNTSFGNTLAGSSLRYAGGASYVPGAAVNFISGSAPSGTWRAMGNTTANSGCVPFAAGTVWLRIS